MAKNTVVVLTTDQEKFQKKLEALKLSDLEIIVPKDPNSATTEVLEANIFLANPLIAKKYINEAKKVVWMQSTFAGIDAMNASDLRKDYLLTNVRDLYGEVMAEYVLSYILLFEKEILENLAFQKEKIWKQREVRVLKNKVMAILGTGSIGQEIARTAKTFGMRTTGYRTENEPVKFFDVIYTEDNLRECLSTADYVISVLPKTEATTHIFNVETFSWMKNTAVFMNIGRGNAVNEKDLIAALKEKKIAKVVLDVFQTEPLPSESELWTLENLYLTPHLAGYVVSDRIFEIFSENYSRFLRGEELKYQISFAKGY